MNGRKARQLRREAISRNHRRRLKREAHADQGQHPKFKPERRRRNAVGHGPTWPSTDDQRKQSRPLIVIQPVKQMCAAAPFEDREQLRRMGSVMPKHYLDAAAVAQAGALLELLK